MATLVRAANAHSLFWVMAADGKRVGRVWGLDGFWRWSVGGGESRDAPSFEAAEANAISAADSLSKPPIAA